MVEAIVENLDVQVASPTLKTFLIADLGCSTGPNTFFAVNTIIDAITRKYKISGHSSLSEFFVYFNDRVSNDFNTLFASLPPERQYLVAGVPGSFHGRLFPKATLDFIHSAFAIQWLSGTPEELVDPNSPAYNEGRIFYSNAPNEVGQAYAAQYAKDIGSFLAARAQELVPGGLMALLLPGRPDGILPAEASVSLLFEPLESCLLDMANEGIISKAKIDSFNLPIYCPSPREMRALVQKNGCFSIAKLLEAPIRTTVQPRFKTQECRAAMEPIISGHFGSGIIAELFERIAKKAEGLPLLAPSDETGFMFLLLKRNQ